MRILKNIYFSWQRIRKKIFDSNLGKKLKSEDLFFVTLSFYLFVQVFSESQLNDLFLTGNILFAFRIVLMMLFAIQAVVSLDSMDILHKTKMKLDIKNIFLVMFLIFSVINAFFCGGGQGLLTLIFIVFSAIGKSLKQIFNNVLISLTVSHFLVLFLCEIGFLSDSIDIRWLGNQTGEIFSGEYVRHTFGFLNSNQIPLIFMLLLFMYVGVRAEKLTVKETILAGIINYFVFKYCGSRISYVLVSLFLIVFWCVRTYPLKKKIKINWLVIGYIVYPITFLISLIGAYAYKIDSMFWTYVNLILNNRLILANKLLFVYPLSIFGYGKYAGTYSGLGEATADNGYVLMFLQMGIVLSVMILILHEYIMHICIKKKCTPLVLCFAFIAIENLINAHMPSYKLLPLYCILVNSDDPFLDSSRWLNRTKIGVVDKVSIMLYEIKCKLNKNRK